MKILSRMMAAFTSPYKCRKCQDTGTVSWMPNLIYMGWDPCDKCDTYRRKNRPRVYLAGGLKGGWQDIVISMLDRCEIIDPRSWNPAPAIEYTARDLDGVRRCDIVLAYMEPTNPSGYGMSIEIGYAHALNKKIIFCDQLGTDKRTGYFGMHRVMATVVVGSLEDAVKECR